MTPNDFKEFTVQWQISQEIGKFGKEYSVEAMKAVFEMFLGESIQNVVGALKKYRETNKEAPTPSDILELIRTHRTKRFHQAKAITYNKPLHLVEYLKDRK